MPMQIPPELVEKLIGIAENATCMVDRGDPTAYDWAIADLTRDGAWHDLDCSSIVPHGAKFIFFRVVAIANAANKKAFFRENGNSNGYNTASLTTQVAAQELRYDSWVACDSDQVIEYNIDAGTFTTFNILIRGWML